MGKNYKRGECRVPDILRDDMVMSIKKINEAQQGNSVRETE